MLQQQVSLLIRLFIALDSLSVVVAAYAANYIKQILSNWTWSMEPDTFIGSMVVVLVSNLLLFSKLGLYKDRKYSSFINPMLSILVGCLGSFCVLSVLIFLFQEKTYSRLFFVSFLTLSFILIIAEKIFIELYFDKILKGKPYSRKILVIGNEDRGKYVVDLLNKQLSLGHQIIGFYSLDLNEKKDNCITCSSDLEKIIRTSTVDEIVFALNNDKNVNLSSFINLCRKTGILCRILPSLWNPNEVSVVIESCQGVPFLLFRNTNITEIDLFYKRTLDIIGGIVGIAIFALIFPIAAAAIKLDSQGPVLFRQKRVGKHGRVFDIIKFRTMLVDAEGQLDLIRNKNEMKGHIFKIKNDPRCTRVGKWMRRLSIDELPQFWNVLKGNMSLVGTRPPTLDEFSEYRIDHLKRIAIKPGITGMWQVSGRNSITDFETIVAFDCSYIENWSLLTDFKILAKTCLVVFKGKGAY